MSTARDDRRLEDKLRDALRSAGGNSVVEQHIRATIRASLSDDDTTLVNVYEQEAGPEQAEVDLHLEGPGAEGHSTNALQFSRFVSGMSEAVKQTAKARAGRSRYSDNLLIEGATPGSVRVVFRIADQEMPAGQTSDPSSVASSVDSDALRTVASILGHANDPDPESPLAAEVSELPGSARQALKRVVNASVKGGWGISGSIRQRHVGLSSLRFTVEGAVRLRLELESSHEKQREAREVGRIDGFRWSLGAFYFIPLEGRPFAAGVTDARVAHEVTELMSQPDQLVVGVFDVIESFAPGAADSRPRVSRVLKRVDRLGEQQAIPMPPTRPILMSALETISDDDDPPPALPPGSTDDQ
ncbi:hypothetical protein [Williamsia muralis]|uniref:hypothetical protein n=1 Tax=Williamsia marianensis TaxID=85044 RepID=UPI001180725A|nr:hypothetical protein [Williamsia marianensis]